MDDHEHSADCHRLTRDRILIETEILLRLMLDGDKVLIDQLLAALRDRAEAA